MKKQFTQDDVMDFLEYININKYRPMPMGGFYYKENRPNRLIPNHEIFDKFLKTQYDRKANN